MPSENEYLESLVSRSRSYAGIGSRLTPAYALSLIEGVAAMLGDKGILLRSGGAQGADTAFEWGCCQTHGRKEIFLPWRNYNGSRSPLFMPSGEAEEIASHCHPNWGACTSIARRFHARNCQQILGQHLDDPVDFVVFWAHERNGVVGGGTATAVHLARRLKIPTFNLRCLRTFRQWSLLAGTYLAFGHPVGNHPFSFLHRVLRHPPGP